MAAVLLQLILGLGLASGADAIAVEVRPLLGGRFVGGGWLAVEVRLVNDGAPQSGRVAIDGEDGTVYRPVELPAGSRKEVVVYVRPQGFVRQIEARFEGDGGRVLATGNAQVRALPRGAANVLIVGDGGGIIRAQVIAEHRVRDADPITILPRDVPGRAEPLNGIGTVVWAADSTGLVQGQIRGLERWVASGGHLVIIGGADWQARSTAFGNLLPVGSLVAVDGADAGGLAMLVSDERTGDERSFGPLTVASGELRDGGVAMATFDDGRPLLAGIALGAGRVTYLAADIGAAPLSGWSGASALWGRLLGGSSAGEEFGGFPMEHEQAGAMAHAIGQLPALAVPPAELLLTVIVGYILLIGPVNYAVLRRIDRRELAWVTAPLLVIMFSAGTYGIGSAMKGSSVILNEITVVRTSVGGTAASVQTYAGIFSPGRATYDLTIHGDALLAAVDTSQFGAQQQRRTHLVEQGDPARFRGLRVNIFGLEAIRADTIVDYSPWLQVSWKLGDGRIEGSVVNDGSETVEDVAVISVGGGTMVGDLAPGERKEFTLRLQRADGRSPADAVYGSMGFDPRNDEQRRVQARRSVVESLIGYQGWPSPAGGIDRGPYVIGWHTDPGPVSVEVDGERPQHFSQTVEVVSGRPSLGPGAVHLGPAQLSVSLAETEGETTQHEPGYVSVGNGSATFRIGLPLEAAGLVPTRLTLLASGDPSAIFFDQRDFGGFFPPGYEMSAWNVQTDDWELIGDIAQRGSFDVADPAAVIDASGQILVRISGSEVPAHFGQSSVFVGASITGVMDQ